MRVSYTRREFCVATLTAASLAWTGTAPAKAATIDLRKFERDRVVGAADHYLQERPITITEYSAARSAGGRNDYFSEGDYWWPDPKDPNGPYIQRDGMTNPDNFVAHRHALIRLSVQLPALTAAWLITKKEQYAKHAAEHLRAWFVEPSTRMNPNLQYAQAIHGRVTGRGIGIIDTLHLVEVARAIPLLPIDHEPIKQWFAEYLEWMTTSKNGMVSRALYSLPLLPTKSGSRFSAPECRKLTCEESMPPSSACR